MKNPITWKGFCFPLRHSDDLCDHYSGDGVPGRLTHQRNSGLWMACLREAKFFTEQNAVRVHESVADAARTALDGALAGLRARVAGDVAWLKAFDEEQGE